MNFRAKKRFAFYKKSGFCVEGDLDFVRNKDTFELQGKSMFLTDNDENINPSEHLRKLNDQIALEKIAIDQLKKEIATVIVGQEEMNAMAEKVVAKGYQANIHAIGIHVSV